MEITTGQTREVVVETGRSAVFKHRVEVLVEGSEAYVGTGAVEATRYNQDTLVLLTTKDAENTEAPLVSGPGSGRAVVVKGAAGRVSSLLHHAHEGAASLNYKRALATLLTPAHHDSDLTYYSQADVLGSCEVHYERKGLKTSTWRDLTRCSHFTLEMVLGAHSLPLLHLALDVLGSTSSCEYSWRDTAGGKLQGVECEETLLVGPRYAAASQVLNVTLRSQLLLTATTTFNPAVYDYLEEATISTDLTFQAVPYQDEGVDVDTLMKEACASEGRGRLTGSLLQKMSQLVHALARGPAPTPDLSYACPITVRYG
ncbi:putative vitellogenin-like [Penaeus vannamei]|uniref:Putative vitellogenin-like n=1 Tax=Penaeus vannamei TaxID=6689 RepID=A0A3R7NAD0_PENVA|nr:putative vitellogenin-like [Penaeus vannamei]